VALVGQKEGVADQTASRRSCPGASVPRSADPPGGPAAPGGPRPGLHHQEGGRAPGAQEVHLLPGPGAVEIQLPVQVQVVQRDQAGQAFGGDQAQGAPFGPA
jgi:hypothetical protein